MAVKIILRHAFKVTGTLSDHVIRFMNAAILVSR